MVLNLEKYGVGIALALFLLAIVYCFTEIGSVFQMNTFVESHKGAVAFGLSYCFAFLAIMFKVMLVLFFIYIFVVIYNIAIVGIFKPLISANMDSDASVSSGSSAREIVEKARVSYYEAIKVVAKKVFTIAFGFFNIPNTLLIVFGVIPLYLLVVTFSYYQFVATKEKTKGSQEQNILNTTFMYFTLLIFIIMTLLAIHLIYIVITTMGSESKKS